MNTFYIFHVKFLCDDDIQRNKIWTQQERQLQYYLFCITGIYNIIHILHLFCSIQFQPYIIFVNKSVYIKFNANDTFLEYPS